MAVVIYTYYARQQAWAAINAARTANQSVADASDAMKLDERAWVGVVDISRQDNLVKVVFINSGRTPATNFSVRGVVESNIDASKIKQEDLIPGHGVIAPQGKFTSVLIIKGHSSKSDRMRIHGRVDYDTVFSRQHWSTFCYDLVPTGKRDGGDFSPCDSGNDIEAIQPKVL